MKYKDSVLLFDPYISTVCFDAVVLSQIVNVCNYWQKRYLEKCVNIYNRDRCLFSYMFVLCLNFVNLNNCCCHGVIAYNGAP